MVSPDDLKLLTVTDEPQVALDDRARCVRGERRTAARTSRARPTLSNTSGVELRDLPSVDELAREAGDPLAVDAARVVIERAREEIRAGADPGDLAARLRESSLMRARRGCEASSTRPAWSSTRISAARRCAEEALARVVAAVVGYSNLEYDLDAGERGSRQDHCAACCAG